VTKIKTLGDKRSSTKAVINVDDEVSERYSVFPDLKTHYLMHNRLPSSKGRKQRPKMAKKKLRVDSDDEDVVESVG
jgi:hypothetical protein